MFDKDVYEVEISESAPPHSLVLRFKRPPDSVGLSISSGNEGEEFYLEPKSGVLYTSKWLDAEAKSTFTLTIDSRDRRPASSSRVNQLRRQSVAKVIIRVKDWNDHDPKIVLSYPPSTSTSSSSNSSEVFLLENEPEGTRVAKITAKDQDQGENGYVTYSIANLNPVPFTIDHFTGEIRTTRPLDYETDRRQYKLFVRASDWGQPARRESELSLVIKLKNANDNRPVNSMTNCVAMINRNAKFEMEFGKVEALDFDAEDPVSYRIVGGNEDSCFAIDQYNGRLRVMCDLRDLRVAKRFINVTASDGEYYSDIMTVKIQLTDGLQGYFNGSESSGSRKSGIKLFSTSQSVFECQDTGVRERYDRIAALAEENNNGGESDADEFLSLPVRFGENLHTPRFLHPPTDITVS